MQFTQQQEPQPPDCQVCSSQTEAPPGSTSIPGEEAYQLQSGLRCELEGAGSLV